MSASPQSISDPAHAVDLRGTRVTIVASNYAPEPTGTGPYTRLLAEAIGRAGAEVTVITGVPHYPQWVVYPEYQSGLRRTEHDGGVTIRRFRHWVPRRAGVLGRLFSDVTFALQALPALWRERSDAVIAVLPSVGTGLIARAGKRKRSLGVLMQDFSGAAAKETGALGARLARVVAATETSIVRSATAAAVIDEEFRTVPGMAGVDPDKVSVLQNPRRIEVPAIPRQEARRQLGWRADAPVVVHTGNIGRKQGLEYLVAAAALSPDIEYVIVGDGNQRKEIEAAAAELDNVTVVPPVSEDEYPLVLAAADVLVVVERPTVSEMSLPSKLTSYVAANRPILGIVAAGSLTDRTLRRTGAGFVINDHAPEAIDEAVKRLLSDPDLVEQLSVAQAALSADLSPQAAACNYQRFAAELVAN